MIKRTFTALSAVALLGLAACGDTVEEGDTTVVEGEDTMAEPVPVELPETNNYDTDPVGTNPDGDSVSISEDGVAADINDGNTSVDANLSRDPSVTVETD